MKLILNAAELTAALRLVGRRLPVRPAVPVMAGLQLTASGSTLTLATTDFEVTARAEIPAAVREEGTAVVPGRELRALARTLPRQGDVDVTVEFGRAGLAFGTARVSIPVLPADEYPTLPGLASASASLPGRDFTRAVAQVATAAGTDETLPVLTGVRLQFSHGWLKLTATDRYRIASRELPVARTSANHPQGTYLLAAKALKRTALDLRRAETVSIALPDAKDQPVTLSGSGGSFTHRPLADLRLPTFESLVPTVFTTTVTLETRPLIDVLTRVGLVGERHVPAEFRIHPAGHLGIRSGTPNTVQVTDRLDTRTTTGEAMRITFNPVLLLEGLRALKCRTVQLSLTDPGKPALLHRHGADRSALRYLLMPVRLQG
ncbi:DNA polymerase III subunit beta [Streptomyces olivoreticuli]